MRNIIKALNYQTRRDNATYIILFLAVGMMLTVLLTSISGPFEDLNGSIMSVSIGEAGFMAIASISVLFTARICGWDFNDKTVNYELLSGHNKTEVFFSRVIVSLVWVTVLCLVCVSAPVIFCTAVNGWGSNADIKGMLIRLAMLVIPIFRTVCEMVLLTFLVRNCYASMILGWLGYEFGLVISMMPYDMFGSSLDITLFFSASSVYNMLTFSNFSFGYVDSKDIQVFETGLSELHFYGTIATGLGVGAVCLALAYLIFRKRDMN